MPIPVLLHTSWRHLLRSILGSSSHTKFRSFPVEFQQSVLVAPVTLARWIAQVHPELLDRQHLNLVIAGAAKGLDSIDTGRWYQWLPALLGRPAMTVTVTMVGPELIPSKDNESIRTGTSRSGILTSAGAEVVSNWPAAEISATSLADWWNARAADSPLPDACFLFHPGFEAYAGSWLSEEQGLIPLMLAGVPVGLCSSCEEELWQEEWLVRKYGCAMDGQAQTNPFALERDNRKTSGQWAAIIWSLDPILLPATGFVADRAQLVRFHLALEQAKPAFSTTGNAIFGFVGGVVPIQNPETGEQARLVGLPAGVMVCLESGQILGQNTVGSFELIERIPALALEFLDGYPGDAGHPVDRFIWASELFRGYIEPVFFLEGKSAPNSYFELFDSRETPSNFDVQS